MVITISEDEFMISRIPAWLILSVGILLLVSGCKTVVSDFQQGISRTIAGLQAGSVEEQADKEYGEANYEKAFPLYLEAAKGGSPYSQFIIGNMYINGEGTRRDEAAGRKWIKSSADNGYAPAIYGVGLFHLFGFGSKQDPAVAAIQFETSAGKGHAPSMLALGAMKAVGLGVKKDRAEAVKWLRMARGNGIQVPEAVLAKPEKVFDILLENQPVQQIAVSNIDKRDRLRLVQRQLYELGYEPGPIDGLMGPSTSSAIRAFQKEAGLPVDGQPSAATIRLLNMTFF